VEGGPKGIKKFVRLMLKRVDWDTKVEAYATPYSANGGQDEGETKTFFDQPNLVTYFYPPSIYSRLSRHYKKYTGSILSTHLRNLFYQYILCPPYSLNILCTVYAPYQHALLSTHISLSLYIPSMQPLIHAPYQHTFFFPPYQTKKMTTRMMTMTTTRMMMKMMLQKSLLLRATVVAAVVLPVLPGQVRATHLLDLVLTHPLIDYNTPYQLITTHYVAIPTPLDVGCPFYMILLTTIQVGVAMEQVGVLPVGESHPVVPTPVIWSGREY